MTGKGKYGADRAHIIGTIYIAASLVLAGLAGNPMPMKTVVLFGVCLLIGIFGICVGVVRDVRRDPDE